MQRWRSDKVEEWNVTDSKLRRKHPTRESLDAWMEQQCATAARNKAAKDDAPGKQVPPMVLHMAAAGDLRLQKMLARGYFNGDPTTDKAESLKWYLRAAEQGDLDSMLNASAMLKCGQGVPADLSRACIWLEKAALKGHHDSAYHLACYLEGASTPNVPGVSEGGVSLGKRNTPEAIRWWRVAAEGGIVDAMFQLGNAYVVGKEFGSTPEAGVPQDTPKALEWFTRAADAGHKEAPFCIALMYMSGLMPADPFIVRKWLALAKTRGDPRASECNWQPMTPKEARRRRKELSKEPDDGCKDMNTNILAPALTCSNPTCTEIEKFRAPASEKFRKCTRCHRSMYCSRECQRKHWKTGHKAECSEAGADA
jgi:TPR repeat protein